MSFNADALRQKLAAKRADTLSSQPAQRENGAPAKSSRKSVRTLPDAPHSNEAERGVLSSMLQDPKSIPEASRDCQSWFFYNPNHRTLFETLCDQWDSGASIDMITYTQFLRDKGLLEQVGGVSYIVDLQTFVPSPVMMPHYIGIVREKAVLRETISVGQNLARAAHGNIEGAEVANLLDEFSRKIERVKHAAGGPNGYHELTTERLRELKSIPDKNSLVGNRWLCRGGNALWAAGAGYGKSSLTMQLGVYWGCGQSVFGLKPHFPIKSLIVQAENDDHDMAEQYNGVLEGIAAAGDLDVESNQATIDKNLVMVRMEGISGLAFVSKLQDLLEIYRPAIVWIDPLFSFAGCDLIDAEHTGRFLREWLFPLFTKFSCCGCVIHHVGKPPRAQQSSTVATIDEQYLSFGSSEIQNAFRAVNVIKPPTQDAPGVFRLILSKRGERAKAKDTEGNFTSTIFLKHSWPHICWQQVAEPEKEEKKGAATKYEGKDILEQMSVLEGKPIGELQAFVSEQTGMSRAAFYRLWKELREAGKVRVDSDRNWFPKRLQSGV